MGLRRWLAAAPVCGIAALTGCPLGGSPADHSDDIVTPEVDDRARPQPDNVTPDTPTQTQPPRVPAELTGYWRTILTYLPGYYTWIIDPGDFSGSIGATYYFGADGQYRYDLDTASTYFGGMCFRSSSWSEWGTFTIAETGLALAPARASNVGSDTCGEWVLDDNAPTKASTLSFTIERDATGAPQLRLRFPSGEDVLLERCRDCE